MPPRRICVLIASAAVVLGLAPLSYAESPKGPIQVRIWKNVMVPMRDGVRLATDVYLPNGETTPPGPFPVILVRHPYGKHRSAATAEFFTTHGYAAAIQDTRGRYDSEGEFYIYVNEGEDGYDAVEWIASQPWSNGNVGTYGGSYSAACQNALAALRPPHLRTMFAYVGTSNYIEDGAGRGGAFALLHNMVYGFRLAQTGKETKPADPDQEEDTPTLEAMTRANEQLRSWLMAAPLKSTSPLSWTPSYAKWYADWRAHPTYDDYWKQNGYNFEERYSQYPDIPIFYIGGWYDIFKRGTVKNFQGLTGRQGYVRLLVGPWTHSTQQTYAGDVDFGPEAKMTLRKKALRWFDQFLKGKDLGLEQEAPGPLLRHGRRIGEAKRKREAPERRRLEDFRYLAPRGIPATAPVPARRRQPPPRAASRNGPERLRIRPQEPRAHHRRKHRLGQAPGAPRRPQPGPAGGGLPGHRPAAPLFPLRRALLSRRRPWKRTWRSPAPCGWSSGSPPRPRTPTSPPSSWTSIRPLATTRRGTP